MEKDESGFETGRRINMCCADDTSLRAENGNNLQTLVIKVKEQGEKKETKIKYN